MKTHRPKTMPAHAQICLQSLAESGLGNRISLGGAFGLMHYFEYRSTFDVDAWWHPDATNRERQRVVTVLEATLQPFGSVRTRSWGDVVSVELRTGARKAFSFQIAQRSAQLEPPTSSPWADICLDSFPDLVANKMVALVERGAPRDLLDIYTLCQENLVTAAQCWQLWRRRQTLAGSDAESTRARLAIQTHLARLEQHRPLASIADANARASAQRVRTWFKAEFVDALT